jgi:hypothetical protein
MPLEFSKLDEGPQPNNTDQHRRQRQLRSYLILINFLTERYDAVLLRWGSYQSLSDRQQSQIGLEDLAYKYYEKRKEKKARIRDTTEGGV